MITLYDKHIYFKLLYTI